MRHHSGFEDWKGMHRFMHDAFGRGEGGPPFGGREFGRGFRGGRGVGRPFDHGELRLVVLAMVAEQPRHGYEIIKAIEERLGGSYSPSPGVVYPTLTMLEELGHTTVEEAAGKKLYTITPAGLAYLVENKEATDRAMGRMNSTQDGVGFAQTMQLMRAVSNFKMALKLRQRGGPLTGEQVKTIVAAIDAAAITIERS